MTRLVNEDLNRFIQGTIEDMEHNFIYATTTVAENHGAENAQRWLRQWLKEEKDKAFGALLFTNIYDKSIDEDTFNDLYDRVDEAYNRWYDKSWEIKEVEVPAASFELMLDDEEL